MADVLAGYAAAGLPNPRALPWLLLATIGLYGGGVVLNDVFDAKLDARERPERPIPRGQVSPRAAGLLGASLLAAGTGAAFQASLLSGLIAVIITACGVLYDAMGKHQPVVGPLNMGTCRGLNLLLGVSAAPGLVGQKWYLALIPVAYVAAITAVSRGEVHGGGHAAGLLGLALVGAVILALLLLPLAPGVRLLPLLPFLTLFTWRVLPAFWKAYSEPEADHIRAAVRAGVLSLIIMDATIAAGYAGLVYGAVVLALLVISAQLARVFAVT